MHAGTIAKRLPDLLAAAAVRRRAGGRRARLPARRRSGWAPRCCWYCALLRRWPHCWLLLVPAALPVLDLAPWTGRFFLDEFDALLAATLLMRAWRGRRVPRRRPRRPADAPARGWLALFCCSTCLALVIGAWPFPAPGLNGLNHYYSPYNGFRLAKGLGWALLLWPLMREALAPTWQTRNAASRSAWDSACSLAALGVRVGARRRSPACSISTAATGWSACFPRMHIGGAYIEAYFALALPFLAWWTLASRRWRARLAGAAMLALGSYALLVTYARAGYLAAAIGMLVLALAPRLRAAAPPGAAPTCCAAPCCARCWRCWAGSSPMAMRCSGAMPAASATLPPAPRTGSTRCA